ncbi:MAG: hypothetical protein ABIS01_12995 [Ferruginibacter sp.]
MENYSKDENIGTSIPDAFILADYANNKGVIYEQYPLKYPAALIEFNKAVVIDRKSNDGQRLAMNYK